MCNSSSAASLFQELRKTTLFSTAPPEAIQAIAEVSHHFELQRGDVLKFTKDGSEYVYVLLSGYVHLYHPPPADEDDESSFFVGWCNPGQLLGEMEALTDKGDKMAQDPTAEVKTHEMCRLIGIPRETLIRVADQTPVIYRNLCKILIDKIVQQRKRAEAIQRAAGVPQFAQAILNLYEDRGYKQLKKGKQINGIISHLELAGYLGLSRTSATGRLQELRELGAIAPQERGAGYLTTITILNLKILKGCLKETA